MRHPLFPLSKGSVVDSHKHSAETLINHQFRGNKGRVGVCLLKPRLTGCIAVQVCSPSLFRVRKIRFCDNGSAWSPPSMTITHEPSSIRRRVVSQTVGWGSTFEDTCLTVTSGILVRGHITAEVRINIIVDLSRFLRL